MGTDHKITIELKFTRRGALALLVLFFLCWRPGPLGSETLVMTTYYPAPYGGYVRLLSTDQAILARDGGRVGIRTPNPGAELDVAGTIQTTGLRLTDSTVNPAGLFLVGKDNAGNVGWADLPLCDNIAAPDSSSNRPCKAPLYRCPIAYSANGLGSGAWASYGCTGQLQLHPVCLTVVFPQSQWYACAQTGSYSVIY